MDLIHLDVFVSLLVTPEMLNSDVYKKPFFSPPPPPSELLFLDILMLFVGFIKSSFPL